MDVFPLPSCCIFFSPVSYRSNIFSLFSQSELDKLDNYSNSVKGDCWIDVLYYNSLIFRGSHYMNAPIAVFLKNKPKYVTKQTKNPLDFLTWSYQETLVYVE